jgi:hypothetical protein
LFRLLSICGRFGLACQLALHCRFGGFRSLALALRFCLATLLLSLSLALGFCFTFSLGRFLFTETLFFGFTLTLGFFLFATLLLFCFTLAFGLFRFAALLFLCFPLAFSFRLCLTLLLRRFLLATSLFYFTLAFSHGFGLCLSLSGFSGLLLRLFSRLSSTTLCFYFRGLTRRFKGFRLCFRCLLSCLFGGLLLSSSLRFTGRRFIWRIGFYRGVSRRIHRRLLFRCLLGLIGKGFGTHQCRLNNRRAIGLGVASRQTDQAK